MHQLVYTSTARAGFAMADVRPILESSRRNNRETHVTGLLVYDGRRFIQGLEGEEATVERLLATIERDERHHDVTVVGRGTVPAREFGVWAMAAQDLSRPAEQTIAVIVERLILGLTNPDLRTRFEEFVRPWVGEAA